MLVSIELALVLTRKGDWFRPGRFAVERLWRIVRDGGFPRETMAYRPGTMAVVNGQWLAVSRRSLPSPDNGSPSPDRPFRLLTMRHRPETEAIVSGQWSAVFGQWNAVEG